MNKFKNKKERNDSIPVNNPERKKIKKNRRQRMLQKKKLNKCKTKHNGVKKISKSDQLNKSKKSANIKPNINKNQNPSILNSQEKFKPILTIHNPEDISGNWKQIKEIINKSSSKKNSKQNTIKNKGDEAKVLDDSSIQEDEIWFDNVDPLLIEKSNIPSSEIYAGTAKNIQTKEGIRTLGKISEFESSSSRLVKEDSYAGVTRVVALDCEMVGGGETGSEDLLARISIVNHYGNVIYDKYVKPLEPVKDYRTHVSGIRPENIRDAESFTVIQKEVCDILRGRIIVGHALSNDFGCLLFNHPKHLVRDTSKYKPFILLNGGGTPSLKKLAEKILGIQIQTGEHSSVQDAQSAMRLYTLNRKEWEASIRIAKKRFNKKQRVKEQRLRKKSKDERKMKENQGYFKSRKKMKVSDENYIDET